ncbi:type II and III secretion system protein family protein [Yunchengibacter salinarum]|uniref:type II and III secretion system protein family protein n=1 Tax=Yunchengibacter salinarum TaxID=3133399 RepID=UPI0035B59AC4
MTRRIMHLPRPRTAPGALLGLLVGLLLVTLLLASPASKAAPGADLVTPGDQALSLSMGSGVLVRLDRPASEVFIANADIADVQVKSPRVVYVFAQKQGETSFYALDDQDQVIFGTTVRVTPPLKAVRRALEQTLPDLPVSVTALGNMLMLSGRVESPVQAAMAERVVRQVTGTDTLLNQISIAQPTQVSLRVRIAEVSRVVLKELGFNWQGGLFGGDVQVGIARGRSFGGDLGSFFGPGDQATSLFTGITTGDLDLNAAIDALDQEGLLTVLAEPNLTALTGESANFLAGGEFPVPVPDENGIGIEYRPFGVSLSFAPTVLDSGRISMRVKPEVSDLSEAGAIRIQGISLPSITTRRAETTVELGSGQSFAIAGLLENSITQDNSRLPGLGDIPILGALFRSESFRREETELLIVVTPYLVRPTAPQNVSLPTDNYLAPTDAERLIRNDQWAPGGADSHPGKAPPPRRRDAAASPSGAEERTTGDRP